MSTTPPTVVMSPLTAGHTRRCREHHEEMVRLVDRIKALKQSLKESDAAYKEVVAIFQEGCAMRAGSLELVTDVTALDMGGDVERVAPVQAHQMELHPAFRPPLPPDQDRRRLAAGDRD